MDRRGTRAQRRFDNAPPAPEEKDQMQTLRWLEHWLRNWQPRLPSPQAVARFRLLLQAPSSSSAQAGRSCSSHEIARERDDDNAKDRSHFCSSSS